MRFLVNFFLESWLQTKCLHCGKICAATGFCSICVKGVEWDNPSLHHQQLSFFIYDDIIRSIIIQAKFAKKEITGRMLLNYALNSPQSIAYLEQLRKFQAEAICFVPIHWRRLLWRGFDLSSLFANELGRKMGIPIYCALKARQFHLPSTLSTSKAERHAHIDQRFELMSSAPKNKRILLCDDIITTGMTLATTARFLEQVGCEVFKVSIARNV